MAKANARDKFLLKVTILEQWAAADCVPEGAAVPMGPVALARWCDAALGVESWRSPNIASPNGVNADLRARFDVAIARLSAASEPAVPIALALSREREINKALAEQIVQLSETLNVTKANLRRAEHLLSLERARSDGLNAKISTVTSIRRGDGRDV